MGEEMRYYKIEMFDGTVSRIKRRRVSAWGDEELCSTAKVAYELINGEGTVKSVCVCTEEEWELGKEMNN